MRITGCAFFTCRSSSKRGVALDVGPAPRRDAAASQRVKPGLQLALPRLPVLQKQHEQNPRLLWA